MKTTNAGFVKAVATIGLALITMGAGASAATVSYSTVGSQFVDGQLGAISANGLVLSNTFGAAATLTFQPTTDMVGSPTNLNYGIFSLLCATCSSSGVPGGAIFTAFTFDLIVTDLDSGGQGRFRGTSLGGDVFSDRSTININFVPLSLGPGSQNSLGGTSFGNTQFIIAGLTPIVAPNSGTNQGQTTVEGAVTVAGEIPEPGTMALFGAGLVGMGMISRRR